MKITRIDYDFDEEAQGHLALTALNALGNTERQSIETSFDENAHKIYYALCEWRDESNDLHEGKFNIEDLVVCPEPFRYKEIKGFSPKGTN